MHIILKNIPSSPALVCSLARSQYLGHVTENVNPLRRFCRIKIMLTRAGLHQTGMTRSTYYSVCARLRQFPALDLCLSPHGHPFYIFPLSPIINKSKGRITTFSELEEKTNGLDFLFFHSCHYIRIDCKIEICKSKYTKRNKHEEEKLERKKNEEEKLERKKNRPRDIKDKLNILKV